MKRLFLIVSLFLLSACSQKMPTATVSSIEETQTTSNVEIKTATPTLFIHGYAGGSSSFGHLIQRMEENQIAKKEMILTITSEGAVEVEGELSEKKTNPMIQVLFEDNESHEWNQAEWIRIALTYLKETYAIEHVNLVGHSMGGVSSLRYLGTYGSDPTVPQVEKFSAIGAPFNDFIDTSSIQSIDDLLENGPTEFSTRYQDYQAMMATMPQFSIQLIGGQLSETDFSDGTVPLTSALAIYSLLKEQQMSVDCTVITTNAQHSQLHENTEVDQLLQQFLWNN